MRVQAPNFEPGANCVNLVRVERDGSKTADLVAGVTAPKTAVIRATQGLFYSYQITRVVKFYLLVSVLQ